MIESLREKIHRKLLHIRLQPIRVYCIHVVSDSYDPSTTWECDWLQTDVFKNRILEFRRKGILFISLSEAYEKIKQDLFRYTKYAVLTADDGDMSMLGILPWLEEQKIPITLFVCPAYLKGEIPSDKKQRKPYMTYRDLNDLVNNYPIVSIASHSYKHDMIPSLSADAFIEDLNMAEDQLSKYSNKIPFYAYPGGHYTLYANEQVQKLGLIPVYCDGLANYNDNNCIHREIMK